MDALLDHSHAQTKRLVHPVPGFTKLAANEKWQKSTCIWHSSADSQSQARITVAYINVCKVVLMTGFMKRSPGAYTLLKSHVTHRYQVSVVMDAGSGIVNFIVNFIRDGTVFAWLWNIQHWCACAVVTREPWTMTTEWVTFGLKQRIA